MATLPRPTRDWTVTANAAAVAQQAGAGLTNARIMRTVVATGVTLGAWTVRYSCDSVTAGTVGDGVNRWIADANVVGAAPGVAHSWSVVVPIIGGQLCFDRDGAGDGNGSLWWSELSGFTGGSTTLRPTAADEIEITVGTNWLHTTNGAHTIHFWVATDVGNQGIRVAVINANVAAGPVALFCIELASTQLANSTWPTPTIARWNGGAATFGNRGDWSTGGWMSRIATVSRQLTLEGLTPQVALDPDGDRLVEPSGLTNAAIGDVGWADDFYFVDDGITNLTTFSDPDGVRRWVVFDEVVWPWDGSTDLGVANVAGAKLRQTYLPADASAELVSTTPTDGAALGASFEASRWQAITAVFLIPEGHSPTARVIMDGHSIWHTAYDGAAWSPLFDPARTGSSVQVSGRTVTMVLLPLGGWWGAPDIKYGGFLEAV